MKTLLLNTYCFVLLILLGNVVYGQTINFVENANAESVLVCVGESVSIESTPPSPPSFPDDCTLSNTEWQYRENSMGMFIPVVEGNTFSISGNQLQVTPDDSYTAIEIIWVVSWTDEVLSSGDCVEDPTETDPLTINVQSPPNELDAINIDPANGSHCPNSTYTLTAMPNNTPNTIFWYNENPQNNPNATHFQMGTSANVDNPGTYYATQGNDCGESDAIPIAVTYIPQPDMVAADMVPASPVCPEDVTTLSVTGGNNGTIKWYDSMGSFDEGNSIEVSPDQTITYMVRSESEVCDNLFSEWEEIMVTVLETPPPLTSISVEPDNYCEGQEIILTATPDNNSGQISWYTEPNGGGILQDTGNPITITNVTAQTYYVRRQNGCDEGNSADFSFEVVPLSGPSAAFASTTLLPDTVCIGDVLSVGAIPQDGVTYEWGLTNASTDDDTNSEGIIISFPNLGSSEISLTVTNPGCEVTNTHTITVLDEIQISIDNNALADTPEFEIAANTPTMFQLSSNFENVEYEWSCQSDNGNLNGSGTGATISNTWNLPEGEQQAELSCTVNATGQCDGMGQFRLIVRPPIFIPDVISVNGDGLNDCWDITVISQAAEDFKIKLYNRSGKCVRGCDDSFTVGDAKEWCGQGCPAGPYWYVIEGADGFQETGALTLIR